MKLALFLTYGICTSFLSSVSQISPANLQQLIASPPNAGKPGLREFYEKLSFETAWIRPGDKNNLAALFEDFERCADNGLQKTDYGWDKASALINGTLQT